MFRFLLHLVCFGLTAASVVQRPSNCTPFPTSLDLFSAGFQQPQLPKVAPSFRANFAQHKWNSNLSHITAGFFTNSPSQNFVRVDEAFEGYLASSFFNYTNTTSGGLVSNTLTTYSPGDASPQVFMDYVNSDFPLFAEDFLIKAGAVFGGLTTRQFVAGKVASWDILYQGVIPTTVYVDPCNVLVGYDYFAPELRTRVVTELFNVEVSP